MKTKNEKKIIAFAGRKRAGKTMCAEHLQMMYGGKVYVIADRLKYLCASLLGLTYDELNHYKDNPSEYPMEISKENYKAWSKVIASEINQPDGVVYERLCMFEVNSIRDMLQVVGTNVIRHYYPDWHIDSTIEAILRDEDNSTIYIDDVRFPNEWYKLHKLGAEIFFIVRPYYWDVSNHKSEVALTHDFFDDMHIIVNRDKAETLGVAQMCYWFGHGIKQDRSKYNAFTEWCLKTAANVNIDVVKNTFGVYMSDLPKTFDPSIVLPLTDNIYLITDPFICEWMKLKTDKGYEEQEAKNNDSGGCA